jgi:L-threonylcarbamoyladenylate synthase
MLGAAARLKAGNLVAFPTETVYGLGADASNSQAVARIYSVKGRPNDHPLIVHIASMERLGDWAREMPEYAIALARSFWPGPMTLILKRSELAGDFITGGQDSVGLRVPDHAVALALLEAFEKAGGQGVAAPSANRFGRVSPTTAEAVRDELSDHLSHLDQIIDGGRCEVGLESTIIDCTGPTPKVLRSGAITEEMIKMATGLTIYRGPVENVVRVSGSLVSHYAPRARVILSETPKRGQGFIALTSIKTPEGVVRLASPSSSREFAQVLYSALREADNQELEEVVVAPPDGVGIEIAIRDRVQRASGYVEFI